MLHAGRYTTKRGLLAPVGCKHTRTEQYNSVCVCVCAAKFIAVCGGDLLKDLTFILAHFIIKTVKQKWFMKTAKMCSAIKIIIVATTAAKSSNSCHKHLELYRQQRAAATGSC